MTTFNRLSLPPDFAQRILDSEIEFKLSEHPSPEIICSLIELYSKGVEYYESIKSYKYLYFKKKMQQIFTSQTLMAPELKQQSSEEDSPISKKLKSKNQSERMEALKFKQKQQKHQKQLNSRTKSHSTRKEADKLMKGIEQKEKVLENKIKSTLEKQDKALEEKLRERKKRSFSKSFSAYGLTQGSQTKESLFNEEILAPLKGVSNQKGHIQPLVVNFQSVILDEDSEDDKQMVILKSNAILPRSNRMASMGRLKQ